MTQKSNQELRISKILAYLDPIINTSLARLVAEYGSHTMQEKLSYVLEEATLMRCVKTNSESYSHSLNTFIDLGAFEHGKIKVNKFWIKWKTRESLTDGLFMIFIGASDGELGKTILFTELDPDSPIWELQRGISIWNTAKLQYKLRMTALLSRY